jgi:tRNA(Ile)-lysidine synthase
MGDPAGGPHAKVASNDVHAAVAASLADALPGGGRIAVALSGGRDSITLLDATLRAADPVRYPVLALHVDHGLSPRAAAWADFCRQFCAARDTACHVQRIDVKRGPRASIEAAARTARYAALDEMARAQHADAVLLGHHADDQAETTLLQLMRGAGPRGLAAMPAKRFDGRLWWMRPLLALPRARLDAYAAESSLPYVDDESNDDRRYRRNALRNAVVPALRNVAPGYPATLLRAAELQADAATLLDDLARIDALQAFASGTLDAATLAGLSPARARNLLRWFLRRHALPAPSRRRLGEMVAQLSHAGSDARVDIAHAGWRLGVHRGRIVLHRAACDPFAHEWNGTDAIELPHGTLRLGRAYGSGIGMRHFAASRVTIRSGVRGERLQLAARADRRRVADMLREARVPHWERQALPRIYCNDSLAAVAPLGIDVAFAASPVEAGFTLSWYPAHDFHDLS